MEPIHRTAVLLWTLLLVLAHLVCAQKEPESSISYFHNLPARLFFFDDRTVCSRTLVRSTTVGLPVLQEVIYHDVMDGNVWVSSNEGKSWSRAEDIPEGKAAMVIEHPFDNNYVRATPPPDLWVLTHDSWNTGIRADQGKDPLPHGRPRQDVAFVRDAHDSRARRATTVLPLRPQEIRVHPLPGCIMRRRHPLDDYVSRRGTCIAPSRSHTVTHYPFLDILH